MKCVAYEYRAPTNVCVVWWRQSAVEKIQQSEAQRDLLGIAGGAAEEEFVVAISVVLG